MKILVDEEIDQTSIEDLREAYRDLRAHTLESLQQTSEALQLSKRSDDITRRRDELLDRNQEVLEACQKLLVAADTIMLRDEATIDHLIDELMKHAKILDFMRYHYSPIGARACELCVYDEGEFIRPCQLHRWADLGHKVLARREPACATDYLTAKELHQWLVSAGITGIDDQDIFGTYLHCVLTELRERRDAEELFVDADLQLQKIVGCQTCADDLHETGHDHRAILRRWQLAQGALCALARIHRGYVQALCATDNDSRKEDTNDG